MRSWRGSSGQPLRDPASEHSPGRGDGPGSTASHVRRASRLAVLARADISELCFWPFLSEENPEERSDPGGGQRSGLVQRFRDAGVKPPKHRRRSASQDSGQNRHFSEDRRPQRSPSLRKHHKAQSQSSFKAESADLHKPFIVFYRFFYV